MTNCTIAAIFLKITSISARAQSATLANKKGHQGGTNEGTSFSLFHLLNNAEHLAKTEDYCEVCCNGFYCEYCVRFIGLASDLDVPDSKQCPICCSNSAKLWPLRTNWDS